MAAGSVSSVHEGLDVCQIPPSCHLLLPRNVLRPYTWWGLAKKKHTLLVVAQTRRKHTLLGVARAPGVQIAGD